MDKGKKSDAHTDWYQMWSKQSKEFFETAEKNLQNLFAKGAVVKPEENLKQINQWVETMKTQWEFSQLTDEQKAYAAYWKMMAKMCNDASDLMVSEWIKRSRQENPINSIRELYELWLHCCQEIHEKAIHSKAYHEAYGDFMNNAFKFWKAYMPQSQ